MRERNLYEVSVKGKVMETFHKATTAYRFKVDMEFLGHRNVRVKKIWVDARP